MIEQKRDAERDLAMCEAATPGPWEWEGNQYLYGHDDELVLITTINGEPLKGTKTFIAEARTALPYWIGVAQTEIAKNEQLIEMWNRLRRFAEKNNIEIVERFMTDLEREMQA